MHDPELLILDEPTSGLDPFLQQEFLAHGAGGARRRRRPCSCPRTCMSEVQQTADRVGIIREGRLVTVERVEELRERAVRRVEIHFAGPVDAAEFAALPGRERRDGHGNDRCAAASTDGPTRWSRRPPGTPWSSLLSEEPDLEELFFGYYSREESARAAA